MGPTAWTELFLGIYQLARLMLAYAREPKNKCRIAWTPPNAA
jgi:hypothetical protein